MTSIQESNLGPREILRVENLSLSFNIDLFAPGSLKESFVRMTKNPVSYFTRDQEALRIFSNLNLTLKEGERVGVLGVNGCGKTSLCRCISSMLYPDTGKITMSGNPLAIFNTSTGVDPELTGRENAYLLSLLLFPEIDEKEREDILEDSNSFSELGEFLDVPFKYYSKGMQARLFLSLVSSKSSELLILDEVFDGADIFFKEKVSKRIMNMIMKSGAVIFVTHALDNLERVCNRAIIMHEGGIYFDGSVPDAVVKFKSLSSQLSQS